MSLTTTATKVLHWIGIYERVKGSRLYDIYWLVVNSQVIQARDREITFYRQTLHGLKDGDLIFDIGANQGYKTGIFLRLGATVVAVDPDDTAEATLKARFVDYRLTPQPIRLVKKAISDTRGTTTMWIDGPGSAKNTLSEKWVTTLRDDQERFGERLEFGSSTTVETTTVDELIVAYGTPLFIKIDVEGHEPQVLNGLHQPVPYLSFEVNLPEFKAEGLYCIRRLNNIASEGEFNYTRDSESGLVLKNWARCRDFIPIYERIQDNSIDVFWRNASLIAPVR